jgi:iduronate 2-sulfatase
MIRDGILTGGIRGWLLMSVLLSSTAQSQKNVLWIIVDDLNSMVSSFGFPQAITPNIERLAQRGVVFRDAYCQVSACNPSRVAMLTGLRPWATGIYDNATSPRTVMPSRVFLPQYFKENGYYTAGIGKVFHWKGTEADFGDPDGWSYFRQPWGTRFATRPRSELIHSETIVGPGISQRGLPIQVWDSPDSELVDGHTADSIVEEIRDHIGDPEPFFLAAGFVLPHLHWIMPKVHWDKYDPSQIVWPPEPPLSTQGIPTAAFWQPDDASMNMADRQRAMAAYLACVTYIDSLVGVILDELDALSLWDDTVVVFSSDHGFHLGEHARVWQKQVLFDEAARCPLLIAAPGMAGNGQESHRVVELQDIFPTMIDLAELPAYPAPLHGVSLRPLLENPSAGWDRPAFTVRNQAHTTPQRIGRSVRYQNWHYVEFKWQGEVQRQLNDLDTDPQEVNNIASDPANAALIQSLAAMFPPEMDLDLMIRAAPEVLPSAGITVDRDGDGLSDEEEVQSGESWPHSADYDQDTINDFYEIALKDLGFDPFQDDAGKLMLLRANANGLGLLRQEELATVEGSIFVGKDPETGLVEVGVELRESSNLIDWVNQPRQTLLLAPLDSSKRFFQFRIVE